MGEAEIARTIDGLLERAASMGLGAVPFRTSADVAQAYGRYWLSIRPSAFLSMRQPAPVA